MAITKRRELTATDLRYLHEHEAELRQTAYGYYQQRGRGALIVDFRQLVDGAFRTEYVMATDVVAFGDQYAIEAAQTYDPKTESFIVLIGPPDEIGRSIMRWRRHRYQPPAT